MFNQQSIWYQGCVPFRNEMNLIWGTKQDVELQFEFKCEEVELKRIKTQKKLMRIAWKAMFVKS